MLIHLFVQSGPVKKDRFVRPLSVYHSSSSSHNRGGGIFSVGRRLPLSRNEDKREMYAIPIPQTRSLDSPPPPPPSSPAPPLPPRVRGKISGSSSVCLSHYIRSQWCIYTLSAEPRIPCKFFLLLLMGNEIIKSPETF